MSWELRRFLESLKSAGCATIDDVADWIWCCGRSAIELIRIKVHPGSVDARKKLDVSALIREFQAYRDDCDPGATINDVLRLEEN